MQAQVCGSALLAIGCLGVSRNPGTFSENFFEEGACRLTALRSDLLFPSQWVSTQQRNSVSGALEPQFYLGHLVRHTGRTLCWCLCAPFWAGYWTLVFSRDCLGDLRLVPIISCTVGFSLNWKSQSWCCGAHSSVWDSDQSTQACGSGLGTEGLPDLGIVPGFSWVT